jgi:predicted transcriptional regulator
MLIELPPTAEKTISFRTDDEMFYCLKELARAYDRSASDLARLAVANLITKVKTQKPLSWNALRFSAIS